MKILHVLHSIDPALGGPIEGVRQRGPRLAAMGHTVELLTEDAPDSPHRSDFPLRVHAVGPFSGPLAGRAHVRGFEAWLRLHAAEYDVLVSHAIWQPHNRALHRVARDLGKPYWIFAHGMLDPWFSRVARSKGLKKWLYWPLQYPSLRDARAVLFTSEEERLRARRSFRPYRVRERVVDYGTAGPPDRPEAQRRAFAQAFPGLAGRRFLLFLSRIDPKKGVDLLLRAFDELSEAEPDLRLAIAGPVEPRYEARLRRLVAGKAVEARVHWLGMLQGDAKWGAFRSAEAFVLPSHQENFGIAVAESLACGTPVLIARPVNVWREIVADGAGLVGEDDLRGVTDLLDRWRSTPPAERAAMAQAARRCFECRFTVERSAQSFLEAVEAGLAEARAVQTRGADALD